MTHDKRQLTILGSTGSVGRSTLSVVEQHSERFDLVALSANKNVELMFEQCVQFQPRCAVMSDEEAANQLEKRLSAQGLNHIKVMGGAQAVIDVAQCATSDIVMAAIVGAAGLLPTLCAVQAGKRVLIANKEPLVMTGKLFMREAKKSGATILPIDSEHNAIFQCLPSHQDSTQAALGVKRLHLTASGGPFRGRPLSDLVGITPQQACAHPNWSMGQKISVDSATLMNKGLELIEATALFEIRASDIAVLIHPQSIIHSMVEYVDGSFLAQLGSPDMRIPIAYSLCWPERLGSGAAELDLAQIAQLDFSTPDLEQLPCLRLAIEAATQGGVMPTILNAANEMAVAAFLAQRLGFCDIASVVQTVMREMPEDATVESVEHVLTIDNEARSRAQRAVSSFS